MNANPGQVIGAAWIIFFVYWLISSFSAKRIAKGESGAGIARRVLMAAVAYVLFFHSDDPRLGVLSERFVPHQLWIAWVGAAITCAGVAFAIWARIHIGRY